MKAPEIEEEEEEEEEEEGRIDFNPLDPLNLSFKKNLPEEATHAPTSDFDVWHWEKRLSCGDIEKRRGETERKQS